MQTEDGNLMFSYEVALDCFRKAFRVLNANAASCGGVRFHFENVALVASDAGRQIVKLLFGSGGQCGYATAEGNLNRVDLTILVEAVDGCVQLVDVDVSTLGRGSGLLSLQP